MGLTHPRQVRTLHSLRTLTTRLTRTSRATLLASLVSVMIASLLVVTGPAAQAAPVLATPPTVSGAAVFNQVLTATPGTWTPEPVAVAFQWQRDGKPIDGATSASYRLGLKDLGAAISIAVTATDADATTSVATSTPTPRVSKADFRVRRAPAVRGVPRFTRKLTASAGRFSPAPDRSRRRWLRAGKKVRGESRKTYRLAPADVGRRIRVEVRLSKPGYRTVWVGSAPTKRIRHRVPVRRAVTYHVETRGAVGTSVAKFRRQAQQTLADPRGWRSAGVSFRRVKSRGDFTLVLAQASWVPRFSSACSATWSCRVGRFVIINTERWKHASPAWNAARLPLRSYRHMVVNHEVGHWLGHGHVGCPGPGRLAPVMMQQSKGLAGCRFNPWPAPRERWFGRVAGRLVHAE